MTKLYSENHDWKNNPSHTIKLFQLVVEHIGKYDRSTWALKNRFTPANFNTAESKEMLNDIVTDLIIYFDDETFSDGGCELMIKSAISICDNRNVPESLKESAREAAVDAGFLTYEDYDYLSLLDDPDNMLNVKIINGELTPEQMVNYLDNDLVKNVLIQNYPNYNRGTAFKIVLDMYGLSLKNIPTYIKNQAKKSMKLSDNAYIQLSTSINILNQLNK